MTCCRRGLFLLPSPDLRTGGAEVREAEKTNAGGLVWPMAGPGEGKNPKPPLSAEPVRACFGDATARPPWYSLGDKDGSEDKDARPPPPAVELAGVSGCSGEAVNMKPPLAVGPAVGFLGDVASVTPALVGVVVCPGEAMNDRVLTSDPVGDGVAGVSSKNAKMLPPPPPPIHGRAEGNEKSLAGDPLRDSKGGAVVGERRGEGEGGGVGVGEESKGWSSSSIFLRGETAGRRQRRLRPPATALGAEKATAECGGSMRSSARWRGDGERKKSWWRWAASIAMVGAPGRVLGFLEVGWRWSGVVGWLVSLLWPVDVEVTND